MYKWLIGGVCAVVLLGGTATYIHFERPIEWFGRGPSLSPTVATKPFSIQFVGDVMLARHVELTMREYGASYPYTHIRSALTAPYVVGNFEASVPPEHVPTPSMVMRFSVDPQFIPALSDAGFTHVSLANNHAYDYGLEGYMGAFASLKAAGIESFGHPYQLSTTTVSYITEGNTTVALIGMYAVVANPSTERVQDLMAAVREHSDIQIVYVHWGTEYDLVHSASQEILARRVIDAGADLVVGHHPHVVQDIGVYNGVPIIYSLGNFIFDQYFSTEVQQGLMLRFVPHHREEVCAIELTPVTTELSRTAPRIMTGYERDDFLEALALRSTAVVREAIVEGELRFSCPLRSEDNSI